MKTTSNLSEEGGNHYERLKIEPVKIFVAFHFNWFQGEILKYVSRFLYKNGVQDLNKSIHIADMAVDLKVINGNRNRKANYYSYTLNKYKYLKDLVSDYTRQFEYEEYVTVILIGLVEENYSYVKDQIVKLRDKYYG